MIATVIAGSLLGIGATAKETDWPVFGGDAGSTRYSGLKQINRQNVGGLTIAWRYRTGEVPGKTPIQCTPIVSRGKMYLVTGHHHLVCLEPATGKKIWELDSETRMDRGGHVRASRGVALWRDTKAGGSTRLFYGTPDGRLLAVDAETGKRSAGFSEVDLRKELGVADHVYVGVSAAPVVVQNVVLVGIASDEDVSASPGHIMAFDVRTGKKVWTFHVIPRPGEYGIDTWARGTNSSQGTTSEIGAAGAWNGFTVDEQRGLIFAATGSAAPDFDGSNRLGDNLFANCVLALDARTGKRKWHYQTVRHDIFDYDNASTPLLCHVTRNGRKLDVVVQFTKSGYCFVLDRETGRPIYKVREVPTPSSSLPGEVASPTQPVPTLPPPLVPTGFNLRQVTDISEQSRSDVLRQLAGLQFGSPFTPPSRLGTVNLPGYMGGVPWSGGSFDPTTETVYINANNVAGIISQPANYRFLIDAEGFPGNKPPWGKLIAIDLKTGKFRWSSVLGEYAELTRRGVPKTGTLNFGGSLVTAGGLVFIAATADSTMRAFDKESGATRWEYRLPASGYAAPMTYQVNGKQYLVIASSGGGYAKVFGFDRGGVNNEFICFALPSGP